MDALYEEFKGEGVEFFLVYKKEAHPAANISAHASEEEKRLLASKFKTEDNVKMPILVDDLEGTVHRLYGLLPNMVYVISKNGKVVYRSDWTHPEDLRSFLANLTSAVKTDVSHTKVVYSERVSFSEFDLDGKVRDRVFERAGKGAWEDYKAGKRAWQEI